MPTTSSKYGSLWSLLDVSDEALIHDMEACLRRAGCYTLDDMAFITYKDVRFPIQVRPIVIRKFKTICDYYAKGYSLKEDTTMQEVLRLMNPKEHPVAPPPMPPPPPPPPPVAEAVVVLVPDPPKPEKTKPQKKRLNVVIIGDCSPNGPGWEHMDHFQKIHQVRLHSIIHHGDWIGEDHDQLVLRCRHNSIKLETKIDSLNVPRPSLYILGAHRLHDLFQLVDLFHTPSAILIELPGAITSKALESLQKGVPQQIPVYINLGRVVAPYVQNTLDVASKLEPNVSWYARENHSVGEMAHVFGKGRLLHSTALEELVIAVMYFGVTVSSICRFQINPGLTERMTAGALTDYVKLAFQMTTLSGVKLSILVDRCARSRSHMGAVTDDDGRVIQQFDHHVHHAQHCDSIIKRRLVRMILDEVTDGVLPTIRIGVEALRLAEYADSMVAKAMEPPPVERKGLRRLFSKTSI